MSQEIVEIKKLEDIEKLGIGDVVVGQFSTEEALLVYEGNEDGYYHFLDFIGREGIDHHVICSWGIGKEVLYLNEGMIRGFIPGSSLNKVYEKGDEGYDEKREILIKSKIIDK